MTGTCRCPCGAVIDHTGAWRHRNTRRHQGPAGLRFFWMPQSVRAGGGGLCPSPRCPPPPAFPPGERGMSEALDRVGDLCRAGFGFLPHYDDEHGEMVVLQGVRVRAGHIETVLLHGEHDTLGARCRDDDHAAVGLAPGRNHRRRHHRLRDLATGTVILGIPYETVLRG